MDRTSDSNSASSFSAARRRLGLLAAAGVAVLLGGCTTDLDSYLDPSKVGRYEATPTSVPILERIAAIEGPADQYVEHDEVRTEDLRPEASEYRLSAGDQLEVRIWDIITPGVPEIYPLLVDTRGVIRIPQIGELNVSGLTAEQIRQRIADASSRFVNNPLVQVTVAQSRKQTFTMLGMVPAPGAYFIPSADYRLLEAITVAGGIPETAPSIYVIRQIPLETQPSSQGNVNPGAAPANGQNGEELIDLIDDLTGDGGGSPAVLSGSRAAPVWQTEQQPAVDLVEGDGSRPAQADSDSLGGSAWIFVNGEWVRTTRTGSGDADDAGPESIVTQRVIRVPVKPLLMGDARYNLVIRPGDVIRVPSPEQGFIYLGGEVNRPGSYNLPGIGPYTLQRAIISAGGLSPIGIPERCDLTRMVGDHRQATIMLNYRAIVEGTQPDIVLKPNDIVTVGTNFWAYPLAVFRNGFRTSYGFGFLLDRNFGNDVFGAPPVNRSF